MKTIAILGASGFIGQALCEKLSSQKINLLLFSRKAGHLNHSPIRQIDLTKKGSLSRALKNKKIDALFYLSAVMPQEFEENKTRALTKSAVMHENVDECWKEHHFHLIYTSSAAVYGKAPQPWKESSKPLPETAYAISKLNGERIFLKRTKEDGLALTVLRVKAPYGNKSDGKTVVNVFLENAIANKDLTLWGSGKRQQDFIYIKDLVQILWLVYQKKKYGLYNVSSGKVTTMKQLAQAAIKATGSKSRITFNGKPDPAEKITAKFDTKKIYRALGISPKYTLAAGLTDMQHLKRKRPLSK